MSLSLLHARRLSAAVVVSLAAHAVIATRLGAPLPAPTAAPSPLEARLAPAPPPPLPRIDPAPDLRPTRAARRAAPGPPAVPVRQLAEATPALVVPAEPVADEAPAVEDVPALEPPAAPDAAPPATAPPVAAAPTLPKRAELIYTLRLGSDNFSVGRAVFTWEADHGSYRLVSASETTGIVDLFRPQRLTYVSEGRLTEDGLRPENFAMSRMRRGQTDAAEAHLDWAARRLTYGRPAHQRTVDLPSASQDIVSFVFQFALRPPAPGRVRLPITNGTRFETYEIEVLAEERIETPMGLLDALPLRQLRREGAEGIEVWLAVDYRYLPVKVRFLDRDGIAVGEQIISEIRISRQ
jgi:uncharacterized protein DUF3108